jgi:hypothetical protein
MNKAVISSYARNLLGQVIGAIVVVMQVKGLATPLEFSQGEWLLVANSLWASLVPVALRYVNKKDPAFGLVAAKGASQITKLIEAELNKSAKKSAKKSK